MAEGFLDLGSRIRKRREELGMTQQDLARTAGFRHHQTVSMIERNQQELKASELLLIARALLVEVSDLLAQVEPTPVPRVLWREAPQTERKEKEARFLKACRRYAHLEESLGLRLPVSLPVVSADTARASFGVIRRLAEQLRDQLGLGSRPAAALLPRLEEDYHVKIWFEDLDEGSSACSTGDFGSAILLNRRSAPWRRNFDLAHELFHLLCWWQSSNRSGLEVGEETERAANVFASSLLLPAEPVLAELEHLEKGTTYGDLVQVAREFAVSTEALLWRLLNLGALTRSQVTETLGDPDFRHVARATVPGQWWAPLSPPQRFVGLAFAAYTKGRLSRMRLAEYLETNLVCLPDRLREYGYEEDGAYEHGLPSP